MIVKGKKKLSKIIPETQLEIVEREAKITTFHRHDRTANKLACLTRAAQLQPFR